VAGEGGRGRGERGRGWRGRGWEGGGWTGRRGAGGCLKLRSRSNCSCSTRQQCQNAFSNGSNVVEGITSKGQQGRLSKLLH